MGSGKFSPRRRRSPISRFCAVLAMSWLALGVPCAQADVADGEALLESFLARTETLSAGFRQELLSADGDLLESAEGEFALERPSHFRWRYAAPFQQLIVADGQRLWMYDVELQQVTVAPLASPEASSPAMLLSGDAAARDAFSILERFERDGVSWIRLEPTFKDTDFQAVLIGFTDNIVSGLEMTDGLNQVTRIEFFDVRINTPLPPDSFVFVPPPEAALIGTP
jgi:outer membrane lipoprotein carrier protein